MRILVFLFMFYSFDSPAVLGASITMGETARNLESLGADAAVFVDDAEQLSFEEVARHLPLATSIDQTKHQKNHRHWVAFQTEPSGSDFFWIDTGNNYFKVFILQGRDYILLTPEFLNYYKIESRSRQSFLIRCDFQTRGFFRVRLIPDKVLNESIVEFFVKEILSRGFILSLAIYNLFQFLSTRKGFFFTYFLNQICALLFLESISSVLLTKTIQTHSSQTSLAAGCLLIVTSVIWLLSVLQKSSFQAWVRPLAYILCAICALGVFTNSPVLAASAFILCLLLGHMAVSAYRQGQREAIYFILGWCFPAISYISIGIYNEFGIMNYVLVDIGWSHFVEAMFCSVAQGQIYKKQLDHTIQTLEHSHVEMSKVLYQHQVAAIAQGEFLENTMPVGESEALVIAFDVINSSALGLERHRQFFQSMLASCESIMHQGYDGKSLTSNAFRIKELGDGFLCSIGFPFHVPHPLPAADHAIHIAEKFIHCFQQSIEKHLDRQAVYCSVAITVGPLVAYFPQSGTRDYSLLGESIVLANRYEKLRKQLFPTDSENIFIIQEKVYQLLSPEFRAKFDSIDLNQVRVRDDPRARKVYRLKMNPIEQKASQTDRIA